MIDFPRLSLRERDRRWALAQRLIESRGLAALLVYGEPEGAGVPHFAADNYFTGDRTGGVVLIPNGEPPQLFAPVHLMVGGHHEAARRGDDTWLEPGQFITHAERRPAGAARGGAFIAECLRERGLATSTIGVIGLGAAAFHPDGIIPAGTWRELTERLPDATLVPVDAEFIASTRCLSDEERDLVRWCGRAGEAMCAAIIEASAAGVPENVPYAAGIAASLRAGAHNGGSVFVVAPGGESVEWGPPRWTYRAQPPRVLADGDVVLAELFPVYGMRETQQQLTLAIGETHPGTDRAAAAAEASYDAAIAAIRPGITFAEVVRAMNEPVEEAGGWNLTPLVHTLNPLDAFSGCGLPGEQVPAIDRYGAVGGVSTVGGDLVLKAGMTLALEPNCVLGRRRVNIGGTVIVTEDGVEEVNTLPRVMHRV
ncbi:M24 family metallopeptidase [Actinoallomurus iriomotensis]|uniref:Peptidase n=1 Tax=Actinoallomurus iriomotensis TaxID=478107 RepID=A0A9W6VZM2_9ACTN|nr:M24 family metallopeptidase [Actinoallomurus iriomotensis]GLY84021.1 putative peptidase [Actinoallomurus iriomotensis]